MYFSTWIKGDTSKATVGIRLVKLLTNITLVGAVCRMFGANIYARIRGVHALGYVICLWRYAIPSFFFLLFFFPWNFNSSLLFLKFSIHQSTYYSIFCAWMSKILYMKLWPGHVKIIEFLLAHKLVSLCMASVNDLWYSHGIIIRVHYFLNMMCNL